MKNPRKKDLDLLTRIIHLGLVILGLLVFSVMALTGSSLFFYLDPGIKARGSIHFIKEIHEVGEVLLPMFFLLHVGAVILHAVVERHYWRIMVFLKEQ